ncbi:2-polyprenyl-3-methyl-5-hydroxy-6-metoxy-1,4-benzoquinol methylase [Pedobacter sp. CAN_A7]|uniref:methyltransferase domain-containing protein n=1 Tax=Pedobacter sp. CAN_A7 TaxID=2787722 RepID=UPI0018CAFB8B
MAIDTTYRSQAPEIMDDFDLEGETLKDALDKIAHINKLLGGNTITLNGVKTLLKGCPETTGALRILDVGCGNGDMLRTIADDARQSGFSCELIGMDANAYTIKYAQQRSANYPEINYRCADIFEALDENHTYDIILCTLTLHHFKDEDILTLLQGFRKHSRLGFVINDLHRSAIAYYLFKALCFVFRLNDMSREDGLISILRGFKKNDLMAYSKHLQFNNYTIKWKWAFRYQWIVKTYG